MGRQRLSQGEASVGAASAAEEDALILRALAPGAPVALRCADCPPPGPEPHGAVDALADSRYDWLVVDPTHENRDNASCDWAGRVRRLHTLRAAVGERGTLVRAHEAPWRGAPMNDRYRLARADFALAFLLALTGLAGCDGDPGDDAGGGADTSESDTGPGASCEGVPAPIASGRTFFVAPDGDDGAAGTQAAPWGTLGFASQQLSAGDTLVLLGGTYLLRDYERDILVPPPGTADAWVVIRGEAGNRPILAGGGNLAFAINVSGSSYLAVENLEITSDGDLFREGINGIDAPLEHVVLRDLDIHHVDEFGVDVADADHFYVVNCRIAYTGFGALGGPSGSAGGWRNVSVCGCQLTHGGHYFQGTAGPSPYDRPDGFGIEESDGPIEIAHTVAEHNRGDGLDSKARNTYIHHCVVANNSCDGVKLWGDGARLENTLIYGRGDGSDEPTPWSAIVIHGEDDGAQYRITNVTVDDALGQNYLMHANYDAREVPIAVTIRNTIFSARGASAPIWMSPATDLVLENDLFYFPQSDTVLEWGDDSYDVSALASLGTGLIAGDPRFVAPAWGEKGAYQLGGDSPAIDAGTPNGAPPDDLEGTDRPQGNGVDIGAYER